MCNVIDLNTNIDAQFQLKYIQYTGWFNKTTESSNTSQISERDVHLKLHKNRAGYYNVEGKSSNTFEKYIIQGYLSKDNTITRFHHFHVRKLKKSISSLPPISLSKITNIVRLLQIPHLFNLLNMLLLSQLLQQSELSKKLKILL